MSAVDRVRLPTTPRNPYYPRPEAQAVACRDLAPDDLTFRLLGIPHRIA